MARLLLGILCLLSSHAWGFDNGEYQNVDPGIRNWFKGVKSPTGVPCCDIADGHATTWRRSKTEGYQYDVPIEGAWYPVPPESIIENSHNPTGETIVWYVHQLNKTYHIRCFVLGSGA